MKILTTAFLVMISTLIGAIFWQQELKYILPTPIPAEYKAVPLNTVLDLAGKLKKNDKPTFLHFFNPACPCSRFNTTYFNTLHEQFKTRAYFYVVVSASDSTKQVKDYFNQSISVIQDTQQKLAKTCGVYSTPQAVIIDTTGRLYFRGNYNKSRYCTQKESNYAEIALKILLKIENNFPIDLYAFRAYGCEIYP
jgi:thioredoxin-related protein